MDTNTPLIIPHTEYLRRKPDYYWPGTRHLDTYGRLLDPLFRPTLNLRAFVTLIHSRKEAESINVDDPENDCHTGTRTGEKRRLAASGTTSTARPNTRSGHGKRRKVSSESTQNGEYVARSAYPLVQDLSTAPAPPPGSSFLPAFHWAVDISFIRQADIGDYPVDDVSATTSEWLQDEEDVISLVESLREGDLSSTIVMNLGSFHPTQYRGQNVAITGSGRTSTGEMAVDPWLFLFPKVEWPDGLHSEDLHNYGIQDSNIHADFFLGCRALQDMGRARIDTNLEIRVLPQGSYDPALDMPFRLRAKFSLSLIAPSIYEPILPDRSRRSSGTSSEGLHRRMIACLGGVSLGASSKLLESASEHVGDVTIPFFLSVLRPAPQVTSGVGDALQPDALNPTLLPFQRNTVAWMLSREGKEMTSDGKLVSRSSQLFSKNAVLLWEKIIVGGRELFFNRLSCMVREDPPEPHSALGGILAEEPGLGKTIECIALMLLNPAPERNPTQKRWDPEAKLYVKEIKTTLIITPPSLAQQWADELATHAPSLKVLVYEGWSKVGVPITEAAAEEEREKRRATTLRNNRKAKGSEVDVLDWCSYVNQFDVCITTYNVLRLDMVVARAPPKRPRRQDVSYSNLERPRSPLVMCEWYRVIMDEVQMMGAGKSEEMVSLVPRLSSFAVSGTPAKAQVSDLIRVLRFLRVDDAVGSTQGWYLFLKSGFKDQFAAFFQHYAVRTLKSAVNDELTIPQQRRYLVNIDLGPVERQVYDQALEESLAELGLDARGVATYEGWQVDAGVLRNVLRRLRGICTHPQVGQLQRQGDKHAKTSVLKSMTEVLEAMREQHWRCLMDDRKAKIQSLVRLAQLQQHCEQDLDRYQRALDHLLAAEKEAGELIAEVKAVIAQHHQKGEALKKAAQVLRESRKQNLADHSQLPASHKGKDKEVVREPSPLSDDGDEDEVEDRGLPNTPAGEEHRAKRHGLQQRLRECYMVLHRVKFLQGDVHHVLGPSYSEKENACYSVAETMRKDLLKSVEDGATKAMLKLHVVETARGVTERGLLIGLPYFTGGGIRSTHLFDEANEIIEEQLNEQTTLIWQWRTRIVTLLTQKLSDVDDQVDGEEYARTLDTQGEAEVYMQAYAALLADRREALLAERTLLAAHESREKKKRRTNAALAARARGEEDDDLEIPDDIEVQPQHEDLHKSLKDERTDLRLLSNGRALKSILVDLSTVVAGIRNNDDPEKVIAVDGVKTMRGLIASQTSLMDRLDADLQQIRKTFNERIMYFRQLQDISDSVIDVEWEGDIRDAMNTCDTECGDLGQKIATGRARQRYLDNLGRTEDGGPIDEDDRTCVLCRCDFSQGFITPCAHVFCEDCLTAWLARKKGGVCPVCRVPIQMDELHRFTLQDERPPPPKPVLAKGELVPTSRRQIEYNMISPSLFREIQEIESGGSYGSKIQTLIRHLLHIQVSDPGSKSIVFSAWADSLHIIEHALRHNGIPSIRLDKTQGKANSAAKKFRTDPSLQVLLLHGERDNAGLNVTCASRVFLVESVVNHGFEVQAIARIDRMGQKQTTEVFCYYAEDTVEKNILDLAARQGLSLYTKGQSAGSINVARFATDGSKKQIELPQRAGTGKKGQGTQKGDFIFKIDDMLAILFPHMFEDIEYLIPPDENQLESSSSSTTNSRSSRRSSVYINAEAGPSRIPL